MSGSWSLFNKLYTDHLGEFYLSLYQATFEEQAVVVYVAINDKSKVLVMRELEFMDTYTFHDPYSSLQREWEEAQ
ncbi:hypothetical protein [Peribacillus frigoritolerans]|uniref:Uncharacterized protein n=1 Tax=Peribacillus castrilensis TaxID=2897690 RepID=A0AAW9NR61_9BACI|nr:hypothetical protein [Peribacillus castrilensis]